MPARGVSIAMDIYSDEFGEHEGHKQKPKPLTDKHISNAFKRLFIKYIF